MANTVTAWGNFERELTELFEHETERVISESEKVLETHVQDIVQTLKDTSNRSGTQQDIIYADGWDYKKTKTGGRVAFSIYNKTKPTLTHLLEFGWVSSAHVQPGNYHISKAFEQHKEAIILSLKEKL